MAYLEASGLVFTQKDYCTFLSMLDMCGFLQQNEVKIIELLNFSLKFIEQRLSLDQLSIIDNSVKGSKLINEATATVYSASIPWYVCFLAFSYAPSLSIVSSFTLFFFHPYMCIYIPTSV